MLNLSAMLQDIPRSQVAGFLFVKDFIVLRSRPPGRVHGSPMGGTTGVSLEQGLGLTDISRGRPGRRPGGERSSPPDYYFIIDKINPGPHRGRLVGPLVPSS